MELVDPVTDVVHVRSQDTAYFPVFISLVAAGHVGVSISAEMRSPNKKKSKPNTNVCLLLWLILREKGEHRCTFCRGCATVAKRYTGLGIEATRMCLYPSERTVAAEAAPDWLTKVDHSQVEVVLSFMGPILNHFSVCRIKLCFEYV